MELVKSVEVKRACRRNHDGRGDDTMALREAEGRLSAALETIRSGVGDGRLDVFDNAELTLLALKFSSLYSNHSAARFDSTDLSEIVGIDHLEQLGKLVESFIVKRAAPLNRYLHVITGGNCVEIEARPDRLNVLFLGRGAI